MSDPVNASLMQSWPGPARPKPITIIGAGGIVRDAHLPAYRKAALPVAGIVDTDARRSHALAEAWDIPTVHPTLEDAVESGGTDTVYDIATPPHVIASLLGALPDGAAVLIQKPMGADQDQARAIRQICRDKRLKAAVNFQLRFSPMMMAVADAVRKGVLGDLLEVEVHVEYRKHKHLLSSSKALAELTPRQHSGTGFPPKSSHRHKNRPSCHRIRPKVAATGARQKSCLTDRWQCDSCLCI